MIWSIVTKIPTCLLMLSSGIGLLLLKKGNDLTQDDEMLGNPISVFTPENFDAVNNNNNNSNNF